MRTEKKMMKVIREVEVETYETGDVLDITNVQPKGKTFDCLRKASRALVMSATKQESGCITYRIIVNSGTDGWTGYRLSEGTMEGARFIKHWTLEELMEVKK